MITWYCAACPAWLTCLPASPQPLSPVPGLQLPRSLTSGGSWPLWPPPGVSGSSSRSRSDLETPDSVSLQYHLMPRHYHPLPLSIVLILLRFRFDFCFEWLTFQYDYGVSDADWGMWRHTHWLMMVSGSDCDRWSGQFATGLIYTEELKTLSRIAASDVVHWGLVSIIMW